jgi:hypothetical protein
MTRTTSQPEITAFTRRAPWNPIAQGQLLWWLFTAPERMAHYRASVNTEAIKRTTGWLVSTVTWLPVVIALLGMSFTGAPGRAPFGLPSVVWLIAAVGGWIAIGWWGTQQADLPLVTVVGVGAATALAAGIGAAGNIPVIVAFSVAVGICIGVVGGEVLMIAFLKGLVVALVLGLILGSGLGGLLAAGGIYLISLAVGIIVAALLDTNLETAHTSWSSVLIIAVLFLSYVLLVWVYLFSGWQTLAL